ncbi:hypothetical protein PVAP13_2KG126908 [Panicum virgatum]|uniref:Uncharacterized protein n=1 Tax=Panicum virgatum TaxID=38727 RepID=A0A8T0WCJ2_PANVG|nr:hypothetical protein PVAP13_2KG126908 [Panicum virgatum]KAG2640909.1 hypothetical protein PVAP13_2KG126908 [Panicum virgatum]
MKLVARHLLSSFQSILSAARQLAGRRLPAPCGHAPFPASPPSVPPSAAPRLRTVRWPCPGLIHGWGGGRARCRRRRGCSCWTRPGTWSVNGGNSTRQQGRLLVATQCVPQLFVEMPMQTSAHCVWWNACQSLPFSSEANGKLWN